MSAYRLSGWRKRLSVLTLILMGCGFAAPAATAQTRTQLTLADVPVYVPAPYHPPHSVAVTYGSSLYDGQAYFTTTSGGTGAHSWH